MAAAVPAADVVAKARAAAEKEAADAAARTAAEKEEQREQKARVEWAKENPGGVWKQKPGNHRDSPYSAK